MSKKASVRLPPNRRHRCYLGLLLGASRQRGKGACQRVTQQKLLAVRLHANPGKGPLKHGEMLVGRSESQPQAGHAIRILALADGPPYRRVRRHMRQTRPKKTSSPLPGCQNFRLPCQEKTGPFPSIRRILPKEAIPQGNISSQWVFRLTGGWAVSQHAGLRFDCHQHQENAPHRQPMATGS